MTFHQSLQSLANGNSKVITLIQYPRVSELSEHTTQTLCLTNLFAQLVIRHSRLQVHDTNYTANENIEKPILLRWWILITSWMLTGLSSVTVWFWTWYNCLNKFEHPKHHCMHCLSFEHHGNWVDKSINNCVQEEQNKLINITKLLCYVNV